MLLAWFRLRRVFCMVQHAAGLRQRRVAELFADLIGRLIETRLRDVLMLVKQHLLRLCRVLESSDSYAQQPDR